MNDIQVNMKKNLRGDNKAQQIIIALCALLVLYFFFGIFGNHFLSKDTLVSILDSSYYIGFLAIGITFVIITGGIDLSIGSVTVGSALIGGVAFNVWGWPMGASLLLVIFSGLIFGFTNGILIGKLKLPPFIATLGTQFASLGLCSIISKVQTMQYPSSLKSGGWFKVIFFKTRSGFPMGAIWLLLFFIIAFILLNKTKFGRYVYAIGSNEEATRLSGINTSRWKIIVYTFSGLCAGLAGVMYAATYTSITPQTGNGQEMYAIAAAVIGGTSLSGGVGSLLGTIIGVFVINVLKNGLMSMGLPSQWQQLLIGIVVILAVLADVVRSHSAKKGGV